jgi:acetoacetate decarboxylase
MPSMPKTPNRNGHAYAKTALVLQGGGALGAYQAGVYEALDEADVKVDWVAGISNGAINAALIAGNPPKRRLERLHQFWERVTSRFSWPVPQWGDHPRRVFNRTSAIDSMLAGQTGFCSPNFPSAILHPHGAPGASGGLSHAMFLNDGPPILGGRELWRFPKKYAQPAPKVHHDTLVGTLDYGPVRLATGTMGSKHRELDARDVMTSLQAPNYLVKIVPHVDGTPRVCELVRYQLDDITVKGAWTGPAALDLRPHALAPVADLPVLEVVSATHLIADLTLGLGLVEHDYLAHRASRVRSAAAE